MAHVTLKDFIYAKHGKGGIEVAYQLSDVDEVVETLQYAGYLNQDGGWLIIEYTEDITNITEARYAIGDSDYAASWASRGILVYYYWNELF
jgi:hypothetical protein